MTTATSSAAIGYISSFSLANRAGYSCYVRAAYSVCDEFGVRQVVITDRIGDHLNLGDSEVRSLKEAGIPEDADVQLVVEVIAAGSPRVISDVVYTYSSDSFRTGSFKCSGTVFNPKVERIVRRPAPPPAQEPMLADFDEKSALLSHKEYQQSEEKQSPNSLLWCCTR